MLFLIQWLVTAAQWCLDLLVKLPLHLWVLVLGGLQSAIGAIPVPSFFADASNYVAGMPPWVVYVGGAMQLKYGLGVVTTSFIARWILRRIPLIG
jgi:hypothetical protein